MKIDESCINHNAIRIISELDAWEISEHNEDWDNIRIMTLGYIKGVTALADVLKETLKS